MVQPPETAPLIQAAGCKLESRQLGFVFFFQKNLKQKRGARKSRFRWFSVTHTIHVLYIYLQLPYKINQM